VIWPDTVLDILLEEAENMPALLWASQAFREADIEMCLRHPDCAVMSDTLALSTDGPFASQVGSLSGYSWAAGFLQRYVRERNVLSLPDAIRRISGLPAQRLGLSDRGTLTVGAKADICVFDPGRIFRQVDVTNPRQYVDGFQHVLVNGCFAIRAQRRLENNAGQVIRGVQKR
jgi:N-acyl-D-amino-acid deacylase